MNVIVSNKNANLLSNLDVDVIKAINVKHELEEK